MVCRATWCPSIQHYYQAVKGGRREYDGLLPDLGSIAEKKRGDLFLCIHSYLVQSQFRHWHLQVRKWFLAVIS